jgi:hypothetical protein
VSKATIILEDSDGGISVKLVMDPPPSAGGRIAGAQWLAGEMLKIAAKIAEQATNEPEQPL